MKVRTMTLKGKIIWEHGCPFELTDSFQAQNPHNIDVYPRSNRWNNKTPAFSCIALLNPRPARIRRAFGSAASAPISLNSSVTWKTQHRLSLRSRIYKYGLESPKEEHVVEKGILMRSDFSKTEEEKFHQLSLQTLIKTVMRTISEMHFLNELKKDATQISIECHKQNTYDTLQSSMNDRPLVKTSIFQVNGKRRPKELYRTIAEALGK